MSLIVADRVQETTNTTGTGAYTLGGAVAGFQAFSAAVSDTDTVYYAITDNVDWEVGLGTYASGADTLTRTTIFSSSNSDAAVDWGVGTKNIFLTYPSEKAVYADASGLVPVSVGVDFNTTTGTKPSYCEGTLFYDEASGALGFYNDESDITLQVGQEEYIRVYNDSGATITNGSAVYLNGASSGTPTIELADASGTYAESQAVGLATHNIENMSTGYVTVRGLVSDLDTSALTAGQPIHVSTTAGEVQTASPTFPNRPTQLGICLVSDASSGVLYVQASPESFQTIRVDGNSHFGANVTVAGNFTVDGTQYINNSTNFSLASPFTYLNGGADLTVTHSGTGLDDATMGGTFEGTSSTTYYVRIDGTGTPDTFEWSKDNFSTTEATDVAITGAAQALDNGIEVTFNATTGHTLNDSWSASAAPIDVDTGLFTNRNTGASGVGYTHMGFYFDASESKWVLLNEYDPEPEGTIDLGDASVVYGTLKGATWEGAVSGNATTASALATGRTIGMTGDVVWTSASFDGSGNVTGTATIQPNSVALGTDTTGNYVAAGATSGTGISGSVSSEGGTFTVTSNATSANTAGTIVARDGSGNFTAGTITADLTGDVTGNADTATALATGRTISLTGDVAGTSGSFDGSGNVSITATIQANSVALGTDTTGNYVASVANGSYLTGGGGASEAAALTLGVDATSTNTASKVVARDASGNFAAGTITAALTGNASTATVLQTARTINGVSFNGSANITVADSTKVPTTRTVSAGSGISGGGALSSNITISHADTSSQGSVNNSGATVIQDVTVDTYGHVTGLGSKTLTAADVGAITGNQTITLSGDLSGSGTTSINAQIASGVVGATELNVTGNGTTAQFLRSDGDGSFTWATPTDTNTTYSAGTALDLAGTTFNVNLTNLAASLTNADGDYFVVTDITNGTQKQLLKSAINISGFNNDAGFTTNVGDITGVTAGTNLTGGGTSGTVTLNVSSSPSFTDVFVDDQILSTGDTDTYMQFHAANQWRVVAGGTERLEVNGGTITANGTFNNTSDERLKKNIRPIDNALSDVCKLQGVSFDWKDTSEATYGFIAQQVEPILPELVNTDEEDGIKSVNYVGLIGHLVEAIKEQQAQIDELKAQLNG